MNSQPIYLQHDFENMEQFYDYIIESKINGQHSQVNNLIGEMKATEIAGFIGWAQNTAVQGGNLQQDFTYCIAQALRIIAERARKGEPKPYQRKTEDVFYIMGNYGQGWEEVTAETTRQAAREQLKCYDENEPQYPHKILKKREKIATA